MKKLDIRKEIATRDFKQTPRPYYWFYRTVMKVIGRKYNPEFIIKDDINECKGPCFVIFNHLSRIDHFYTNEIAYPKKVNMLAGYSEFFRSHLHWAFKMNNVLPKKQYTNDFVSTKAIMKIIKKGGAVSFAPEGLATNDGLNKPIVPNTGAMLKKFGIPVYFVKLRGQYLQNSKVCLDVRKGKTFAEISLLFTPEDLEKLDVPTIDEKINDAFFHDEYKWQKEQHIKWETGGRICEKLGDLLYECPRCGTRFKMNGYLDRIVCEECGNGATMDDYYDFHPFDDTCVIPELVSDWVKEQRIHIIKEIRKDPNYKFVEEVKIGKLPNDHYLKDLKTSEIVAHGKLTIDHTGMRFEGEDTKEHDFFIDYTKLYTVITELDSSYFNLYIDGEYHDIFPTRPASLFMSALIEEMHRLHVNYYKPLRQYAYMYENLDD